MSETQTGTAVAAPTRQQFKDIGKVDSLKELFEHPGFRKRIAEAAGKTLDPDRLLRMFQYAVQKQPKLAKVNPLSLMGIFISLSWLGLEPNTPLGLAHVLPFDVNKWNPQTRKREYLRTDANMIIGYQGYYDLIMRTDKVKDLECDVVWAGDEFEYERGSNKRLIHRPKNRAHDPKEEPVYAYMFARLLNGGEVFEVLTRADVHHHRARSQAFRSAMYAHDDAVKSGKDPMRDSRYADTPWIRDPIPMFRKTALRAGQVWVPKTVEVAAAVALDAVADRGEVDFSKVIDGSVIVDGGYEALEHEQTIDAGAAFGMRDGEGEPDPVVVGNQDVGQQQTGQTQQQAPPAGTAQTAPAAGQAAAGQAAEKTTRQPAAARRQAAQANPGPAQGASAPVSQPASTSQEEPPADRWGDEGVGQQQQANTPAPPRSEGGGRIGFVPTAEDQPVQQRPAVDQTQPKPEDGPGEFYLCDENGEPVADGNGYTNAVWAARGFMHLWENSTNRRTLLEMNADTLDEIKQTPKAADILLGMLDDGLDGSGEGQATGAAINWFVDVPTTPSGKPHYPNYIAAVKAHLAANVHTEADRNAWVAANMPTYETFPPATQVGISRQIAARCEAAGIPLPPLVDEQIQRTPRAATQQQPTAPATDKDLAQAQYQVGLIRGMTSAADIDVHRTSMMTKALLDRFDRERPELAHMIRTAGQTRRAELLG